MSTTPSRKRTQKASAVTAMNNSPARTTKKSTRDASKSPSRSDSSSAFSKITTLADIFNSPSRRVNKSKTSSQKVTPQLQEQSSCLLFDSEKEEIENEKQTLSPAGTPAELSSVPMSQDPKSPSRRDSVVTLSDILSLAHINKSKTPPRAPRMGTKTLSLIATNSQDNQPPTPPPQLNFFLFSPPNSQQSYTTHQIQVAINTLHRYYMLTGRVEKSKQAEFYTKINEFLREVQRDPLPFRSPEVICALRDAFLSIAHDDDDCDPMIVTQGIHIISAVLIGDVNMRSKCKDDWYDRLTSELYSIVQTERVDFASPAKYATLLLTYLLPSSVAQTYFTAFIETSEYVQNPSTLDALAANRKWTNVTCDSKFWRALFNPEHDMFKHSCNVIKMAHSCYNFMGNMLFSRLDLLIDSWFDEEVFYEAEEVKPYDPNASLDTLDKEQLPLVVTNRALVLKFLAYVIMTEHRMKESRETQNRQSKDMEENTEHMARVTDITNQTLELFQRILDSQGLISEKPNPDVKKIAPGTAPYTYATAAACVLKMSSVPSLFKLLKLKLIFPNRLQLAIKHKDRCVREHVLTKLDKGLTTNKEHKRLPTECKKLLRAKYDRSPSRTRLAK